MKRRSAAVLLAIVSLSVVPAMAQGAGVGPNASFQAGDFSHWNESTGACTALDGSASVEFDTFAISFPYPPEAGGATVPRPPGGHAAIFGQTGASWGLVSRTFRIPRRAKTLSFKIWWKNQAAPPYWSAGSAITCPGAIGPQMIYVDLLKPGASVSSVDKASRLLKLWRPTLSTRPRGGWKTVRVSVAKLRGKRVKFRFGALSTLDFLNAAFTGLRVR